MLLLEASQTLPRFVAVYSDEKTKPKTNAFLPRGRMVVFPPLVPVARILTGLECLHIMGHPRGLLIAYIKATPAVEDSFFNDVAGNTFPGNVEAPCMGSCAGVQSDSKQIIIQQSKINLIEIELLFSNLTQ